MIRQRHVARPSIACLGLQIADSSAQRRPSLDGRPASRRS
jgi:hypothetical protein